jgi:hypothetical protein
MSSLTRTSAAPSASFFSSFLHMNPNDIFCSILHDLRAQ